MKKIFLLGAFAMLSTLFSCTADEFETPAKNEVKETVNPIPPTYADGPGDGAGGTTPPPPKPTE